LLAIASNGWFFTAQPEGWVAAISTLAILAVVGRRSALRPRQTLLAGFAIGLCGLIKPFYLGLGLAVLVPVMFEAVLSLRRRIILVLTFALGAAAAAGLVLSPFLVRGALGYLVEVHIRYTTGSYAHVHYSPASLANTLWQQSLEDLGYISPGGILPILCLSPLIAAGCWRLDHEKTVTRGLISWLAVSLLCVAAQGRFFAYHWLPVYPPAIALAMIGLAGWLRHQTARRNGVAVAMVALGVFHWFAVRAPVRETWLTTRYWFGEITEDQYFGSFAVGANADAVIRMAEHLRSNAEPTDKLFVWGRDATVIFLSGLRSSTRFVFSLPLYEPGPFFDQYRSEVVRELQSDPPRFILTGATYGDLDKTQFLRSFPELDRLVQSRYEHKAQFGVLDLFELRRGHW
jgi:hypothetical protein